jgi:hypothetical protein
MPSCRWKDGHGNRSRSISRSGAPKALFETEDDELAQVPGIKLTGLSAIDDLCRHKVSQNVLLLRHVEREASRLKRLGHCLYVGGLKH